MQKLMSGAIAVAAIATASSAQAKEASGTDFGIRARVPILCELGAETFTINPQDSGATVQMIESCNTNRGFQILASHRILDAREDIVVFYDSHTSRLDQSGMTTIGARSGARHGIIPVTIVNRGLLQELTISFSLIAI